MARKIAVEGQSRDVRKNVALLLIRRAIALGIYDEFGHLVRIEMLKAKPADIRELRPVAQTSSIPDWLKKSKLPPREVEGCHFQEPQSAAWKLAHRSVDFSD